MTLHAALVLRHCKVLAFPLSFFKRPGTMACLFCFLQYLTLSAIIKILVVAEFWPQGDKKQTCQKPVSLW